MLSTSLKYLRVIKHSKKRAICTALVPAAGSSSRMGSENKLLMDLNGAPVLARTLAALQVSRRVDEIIVAAREQDLETVSRLCADYKIDKCSQVVVGGETRAHSVLLAAMAARRDAGLLAVHDGARPLITPDLINQTIETAIIYGAAAPAIPVKDTIKQIKQIKQIRENNQDNNQDKNQESAGDAEKSAKNNINAVEKTLERDCLRAIQTPQVFDADLLKAALQKAVQDGASITDDCSAVEALGKIVYLIDGDEENMKITTPMDFVLARAVLEKRMRGE